jgi:rhodanese-related sulfurtransferase
MDFLKKLFGGGSSLDVKALMERGAIVIDVRTPGEFASGHVKGSLNIPVDTIGGQIARIKAMNKPIITVCRSGARSGAAESMLKQAGIEVYNGGPWDSL